MYGEWVYAKHSIYYDHLLHYFIEFDVLDKTTGRFLSTGKRQELLRGLPLTSAPVLHSGHIRSVKQLKGLIRPSAFQTAQWRGALRAACIERGLDAARALAETDDAGLMESLYLKVEDEMQAVERYKFLRASFAQMIEEPGGHWLERPIVPNRLRAGVDIFAEGL
jgi:hypothetical protein